MNKGKKKVKAQKKEKVKWKKLKSKKERLKNVKKKMKLEKCWTKTMEKIRVKEIAKMQKSD